MNLKYNFLLYHAGVTGWVAQLTWKESGKNYGFEMAIGGFPHDFGQMAFTSLVQYAEARLSDEA